MFTSVLFDVLGVNQDLLIVLQQIIQYEQGRLFAEHLAVAGVACQQCYCECPLSPSVEVLIQ